MSECVLARVCCVGTSLTFKLRIYLKNKLKEKVMMQRSLTYAVWRGTNGLRGTAKGCAPAVSVRSLHSTSTSTSQAAAEQSSDARVAEGNERLSENDAVSPNFINRNPRNLERMAVARKDKGWSQSYPRRDYWHKLFFEKSNRHIKAYVRHYNGDVVLSASTKEWAIKQFLYSTGDVTAAQNVGRVLAQRCLESGISFVHINLDPSTRSFERTKAFLGALQEGGVVLNEPRSIVNFKEPIEYFPEEK